jgi:hypothetical protein
MALDMDVATMDAPAALRAAASRGYWLVRRRSHRGELRWAWLPHVGSERPLVFVTQGEALEYLAERLRAP